MGTVSLLRLDLSDGLAPGNKSFKLRGNLRDARDRGFNRLLSFGGAWSNHLHALAALGEAEGFETVGIVRGEESPTPSPMLIDARRWGMQLEYLSRQQYRQKSSPDYLASIQKRYGPCLIIPEGGANAAGVKGCAAIASMLPISRLSEPLIVLPVGTGTTLAGLAVSMSSNRRIYGISVLKGAWDLDLQVGAHLEGQGAGQAANWKILHEYHCGGYARVSPELKAFIIDFERVHQVALDPVYTGKALFAVHQRLKSGQWRGEITAIHTGGLQGRRGYSWL